MYPHRWWILAAVIAVSLMTPLDSSALNIAIPSIQREFQVLLGQVAWAPLVYLLVIAGLILPLARLGDLWGFRRLFLTGIIIFATASALCGFAPSFAWLIAGRVAQGIGACLMMALSPGIVTAIFPPQERGRALGIFGMGIAVGLVLGPTVGGLLTEWQNWRWIFFINLPIGLFGGLWCWRILPALASSTRQRIDWAGALLAIAMLGTLLLAITQGQVWGWHSPLTLGLLAGSLASGAGFITLERRHAAPMLDLTLFSNRLFAGANLASMMNYLGQFCAIFLTPLLLQRGLGLAPQQAGLVMGVLPLAVLVLAPISGALSDRLGTRTLAVVGEILVACGLLCLALVVPRGEVALIVPALLLVGIGAGLFQSPNSSAIMGSVPRTHLGIGGGVMATMRNLGMACGIAVSSAVAQVGAHHYLAAHPGADIDALLYGIRIAYLIGACFVLLGAVTSAFRQNEQRAEVRVNRIC